MARGQFLQGLSEGIFGRLGELRQEQQLRDDQQKSQVIQMLAGLADRIEPEGLPLLMGHIWDTMGVKKAASGKGLRGFLDAFSGMPNRSVEDQLGTKFKEITDQFVGPASARAARQQHGLPVALRALAGDKTASPDMARRAAGLEGKMIFRDPRQEKLEEIETRYGAQLQAALEKSAYDKGLANKYQSERDEANRKGRINQIFTNRILQAQTPQLQRAYQLWHDAFNTGLTPTSPDTDPAMLPPQEFMARAGQILTQEQQHKDEATQQLVPLRKSQARNQNAQANAATRGRPESPLARERFDETKYKTASGIFQNYTKQSTEYSEQTREGDRIRDILKMAADKRNEKAKATGDNAVRFDEKLGAFIGPPGAVRVLQVDHENNLKLYNNARTAAGKAEGIRKGFGEELKSRHGSYVEEGAGGFRLRTPEEIKAGFKPKAKTLPGATQNLTSPPSGIIGGDKEVPIGGTIKVPYDQGVARKYAVGQEIPMMGGVYRVEKLEFPNDTVFDLMGLGMGSNKPAQFFVLRRKK